MTRALVLAAGLLLALGAAPAAAGAAFEGSLEKPEIKLRSDEGLFVLVTDADQSIKRLRWVSEDGKATLETTQVMGQIWLNTYLMKAGRYTLELVELVGGRTLKLKPEDPATPRVEIVAGAFNYAGDIYVKNRQDGIKLRTTGNNLDLIVMMARKSSTRSFGAYGDEGPYADKPFAVTGVLAKSLLPQMKTPPQPDWKLKDWIANSPLPTLDEQFVVINKLLAKSDQKPLELGKTRKDIAEMLKDLPAADGKHYKGASGEEYLWLTGLYGYEGLALVARLYYGDKDKLEHVVLRTLDGWAVSSALTPGIWADAKEFADAPNPD